MAKKQLKKKKVVKLTALEEKRVAIAKDAILQLKSEAYDARSSHGYVSLDYDSEQQLEAAAQSCELFTGKNSDDMELNKLLDRLITPDKPCTVCAKGALLISSIRKYNNFSLQKAIDDNLDSVASDEVRDLFGDENADRIEEYFEGYDGDEKYLDEYPNDSERLIAILQNVVKNKGQFIP